MLRRQCGSVSTCTRMLTCAAVSHVCRVHTYMDEQWYECAEPADDPVITCFLAPEWMDLGPDRWLCSDALKSEEQVRMETYGEDSY